MKKMKNEEKKTIFSNKNITHLHDIEYFTDYPAPIMEYLQSQHFTNINATIPFFGPMLYFAVRALRCRNVLEIGHSSGYTAWYLANAIKDNAVRFQWAEGTYQYYGIDIVKSDEVRKHLAGLPVTVQHYDTTNVPAIPMAFCSVEFDLVFQDGAHDQEHVEREAAAVYPLLKGEGKGYLICHDCFGPAEDGVNSILNNPDYNFESVRLDDDIYGIAILRKMDGYKERKHWSGA